MENGKAIVVSVLTKTFIKLLIIDSDEFLEVCSVIVNFKDFLYLPSSVSNAVALIMV